MGVNMDMNIAAENYQSISKKAKEDIKRIEDRGVSRAETLDDIKGDTTGKSFRTADLEKLMEKYDPEAYAQYSKIAKGANGARTQSGLTFLSHWMDEVKKEQRTKHHLTAQTKYPKQMSRNFPQRHRTF